MGNEYPYDPEYGDGNYNPDNCGEVSNPLEGYEDQPSNEYLLDEVRDSLGADTEDSSNLAKSTGVDLNDGATDTALKEMAKDEVGEDLNEINSERMDAALENFQEDKWSDLSLEEQKQSMIDLADYIAADTGNENPPEIFFRNNMNDGEYGGYNPATNTLEINENMLSDSAEAADTVAHEMWHAHQQQCALDPTSEKGREYKEGFDNYISQAYDFEGYQNQMVEVEAREYAHGFKDRLAEMKGGA